MKTIGLIVAAGSGKRAGHDVPKQYKVIGQKTILRHTIDNLSKSSDINCIQVVINSNNLPLYNAAIKGIDNLLPVCFGGSERQDSVKAGLEAIEQYKPDVVLIHDAARPFVPQAVISNVIKALKTHDGAVAALPVVDALWKGDQTIDAPVTRANTWRAQTPQGFRYEAIRNAHDAYTGIAVDDVTVANAAGLKVAITAGSEDNFKITHPEDFIRAEQRLNTQMDIRTGNGFDVHKFGVGDHVTLCGINIPHDKGLVGHSDADVAMHTITDAIFGALAEGDIGQWFPPSDPQWKGAASIIFLQKAIERTADRGFSISHIDCTIICETPKIGPHSSVMRANISEITKISEDRISIKATTSEKLGFTGRGEGIAAMATATLVKL